MQDMTLVHTSQYLVSKVCSSAVTMTLSPLPSKIKSQLSQYGGNNNSSVFQIIHHTSQAYTGLFNISVLRLYFTFQI